MVGAMTLKQVHVLVGHSGVLWDIVRTLGFTFSELRSHWKVLI